MFAAFEDDAVEFVVCYCNREVCFALTARGETSQEFGVEKGNPAGAGGLSPVEEGEEGACRVVDARVLFNMLVCAVIILLCRMGTYAIVREEDALQ